MLGVSATTNLTHPDVVSTLRAGRQRPRQFYRVVGPRNSWGAHNNDLETLRRGVLTRIMYVKGQGGWVLPPQPVAGIFRQMRHTQRRFASRVSPSTAMLTDDELVGLYHGRKKEIYAKAVESLRVSHITVRDSLLSSFVKFEKLDFEKKSDPDPRIINPRRARYNVVLGRFIKHLEKRSYKIIDDMWCDLSNHDIPTVAKGRNFESRADILRRKWLLFKDPRALLLDCSRFDQHVRLEALKFEHGFYKAWYKHTPFKKLLKKVLQMQLHNRGLGRADDGVIRWEVSGMRASGDMNTAVGNVILVTMPLFDLRTRIPIRFELVDDGDDCVIMCEAEDVEALSAHLVRLFTDMGHELKVDSVVDQFEQIKFCQTQPVFDGSKWLMVRDPRTAMAKDLTTPIDITGVDAYRKYCTAVGLAGLSLAGGLPIWDAFYSRLVEVGEGAKSSMAEDSALESGFLINSRMMNRCHAPVSDEARVSFWRAFGVEPAAQLVLETHLAQAFKHGACTSGPVLQPGWELV